MIADPKLFSEGKTFKTDVCIVGAGVAGITLAHELMGAGMRVCLLESGGLEPDRATQSLYWGENIGVPYYPLDVSRARFFGGSSNCWHVGIGGVNLGARLHPLEEMDFQERDWVPYSGWPFTKAHLDPYYERAHSICHIGPYDYSPGYWEDRALRPQLPFRGERVKTTIFQFIQREVFFQEYRKEIEKAENITSLINSNVIEIETDPAAQRVTGLKVACLNGVRYQVTAKLFILAAGAIEIPRLLLLSNRVQKTGLGNQHDLVGRFFMEHPHLWSGVYIPADKKAFNSSGLYSVHIANDVPVMGKLTLSAEVLQRERLLNYAVSIHPKLCTVPAHQAGRSHGDTGIKKKIYNKFKRTRAIKGFSLNHMSEQAPNPDSRVTLSDETDALGQKRVNLDWKLGPSDMRTILRAQEIIDEDLCRVGLGRLHIEMRDESIPANITGGWHHMGTTRMNNDPKKGVVDQDCRIHGISNLFIAGPSVFPTCGYANPVLTIIALAIRLGDHTKKFMGSSGG